jgi:PAS domain S-box-containing protein
MEALEHGREETDGIQGILGKRLRMAARVTETVRDSMATAPDGTAGAQHHAAASTRREAFFASLSHELRCSLDDEGCFLYLEGAWQPTLGWRLEDLHGWHWEEVIHPSDRARTGRALARLRASGGVEHDLEVRMSTLSGGYRPISWTMSAGTDPDSVIGLGHLRPDYDPNPHSRGDRGAERLLRRYRELEANFRELEERYAAAERFAGMAAHQLAEPLVIAESSAILVAEELGDELDPFLRGRLEGIGRAAARARRLMDALLQDARSAFEDVSFGPVDVGAILQETLASLAASVEEWHAVIEVGPLPVVRGEPSLVAVVLDNLVANALKHGPRQNGVVRIGAEQVSTEWTGPEWSVWVKSGGPPIAQDDARRIFLPFRRVPGERRISGTGLGLAVCARLMERLGGTIGVEPGTEDGNTFWIRLPDAALEAHPASSDVASGGADADAPSGGI